MKDLCLRYPICLMLFLAVASTAFATTTDATSACPTSGSFQSLLNAGSCTIGDKTFSGFFFNTGTSGITATQWTYNPTDNAAQPGNLYGFEFTALPFTANAGQTLDITMGWTVAVTNGANLITSLHGAQVSSAQNGSASISEMYCLGAATVTGCANPLTLNTSNSLPSNNATFAGVSMLSVIKDVNVSASAGTGNFATLSAFMNDVDQVVPEPATVSFFLGGAGLLALSRVRRKSSKRS